MDLKSINTFIWTIFLIKYFLKEARRMMIFVSALFTCFNVVLHILNHFAIEIVDMVMLFSCNVFQFVTIIKMKVVNKSKLRSLNS